jgi:hypothetical protein
MDHVSLLVNTPLSYGKTVCHGHSPASVQRATRNASKSPCHERSQQRHGSHTAGTSIPLAAQEGTRSCNELRYNIFRWRN